MGTREGIAILAHGMREPLPRYLEEQRHRYNVKQADKLVIVGARLCEVGCGSISITPILASKHDKTMAVRTLNYYVYGIEQGVRVFVGDLLSPGYFRSAILAANDACRSANSFHISGKDVTAIQFRSAHISDKTGNWGFVPVEAIMLRDPIEPAGWKIFTPEPLQSTP